MSLPEKEQKFADFFNGGYTKASVAEMSIEDVMVWELQLEDIIFEAKATLQGVSQGRRERVAKLDAREREKLIDNPSLLVSDSIRTVKKRAERMSKAEKMRADLEKLGIGASDLSDIMGNVKIDETKQAKANEKFVFNKISLKEEPVPDNTPDKGWMKLSTDGMFSGNKAEK